MVTGERLRFELSFDTTVLLIGLMALLPLETRHLVAGATILEQYIFMCDLRYDQSQTDILDMHR